MASAGRSHSLFGIVNEAEKEGKGTPADSRRSAPAPYSQNRGAGAGATPAAPAAAAGGRSKSVPPRKSFTKTLDSIGTRLVAQANTSQLNSCYNYQRNDHLFCQGKGIYSNLDSARTVDYLTGIPFSHTKKAFISNSSTGAQNSALVFDGALVYRDTTIQNEAEHLLSLNGMAACFGLPSATFFDGKASLSRKRLIALCSLAGSLRSTNQTKSNHLLQTITEDQSEIDAAFDSCVRRVNVTIFEKESEKDKLKAMLLEKQKQGWAFKINDRLIRWLANSFYTGTDTKAGGSIRFIDFPYCICMGADGVPHENFIRYFVKTYFKGDDKKKYKRFITNSIHLMTTQSQLICDILNMYVDWDTLQKRCLHLANLKENEDPNTINFFDQFNKHGNLIVKCINFEIKADNYYPVPASASNNLILMESAESFFSSFEKDYRAIISRLSGRGSPRMRFNIHSGFFILKKNEFIANKAAGAAGGGAGAAAGGGAGAAAGGAGAAVLAEEENAANEDAGAAAGGGGGGGGGGGAGAASGEGGGSAAAVPYEGFTELTDEEKRLINLANDENPASQSQEANYDPNKENVAPDNISVNENADAALEELNREDTYSANDGGGGGDGGSGAAADEGVAAADEGAAAASGEGDGGGGDGGGGDGGAASEEENNGNGRGHNHNHREGAREGAPGINASNWEKNDYDSALRWLFPNKNNRRITRKQRPRKTRKRNQRRRKTRKV